MNELGRIRLRRHDTVGAIGHFINAARTTPGEHIYSRNIDVVILRTLSRTIYIFVLVALIMLWVPAVAHIDRFPFAVGFGVLVAGTMAAFTILVLRLPHEARRLVRRTLRTRRVVTALAVALGGVAVAFAAVAFVPSAELPQTLPIAIIVTIAARMAATARLRSSAGRNQPGPAVDRNQPSPPTRR
jgi:peptidoglycan/LPS O-acetylase OafA/YrhL